MKNVEKLFTTLLLILLTSSIFSQSYKVLAGMNVSRLSIEADDGNFSDELSWKPGFQFGVMADFPVTEMFSIETGLLAISKGFKFSQEESFQQETFKYESKLNLWYLESPVSAKLSFPVGNARLYGTLGSYLGIGLSGKFKSEETVFGETQKDEESIEWGGEDGLKRLDFGLAAGAGIEFKNIQIGLNYGYGLINIAPKSEESNESNLKNRTLSFSLAYRIAGD